MRYTNSSLAQNIGQSTAVDLVAKRAGVKLFCNTLGDGFVIGIGGDNVALRDPDSVWGWEYRHGISVFQTDHPEERIKYRSSSDVEKSN